MVKRILLFILTNLLVIATISIITTIFGLHDYLNQYGIDYSQLAIFCSVWGLTGSFISLLMSKTIAKLALGVVTINNKSATTKEELFLIDTVQAYSRRLGLLRTPEVGIYHSAELNAFATGPSKGNALVAVSSGLLANMTSSEVDGVIGHEMTHIANGDMVTMTLLQGIINAFSLFLSRIVAYVISIAIARDENREREPSLVAYNLLIIFFDILFTLLGSLVICAFSRWREYRADAGGARLAGQDKMIAALRRLQNALPSEDERVPSIASLKISHKASWFELFSSHPPISKRIERLMKFIH